jgi:hypothetical protein
MLRTGSDCGTASINADDVHERNGFTLTFFDFVSILTCQFLIVKYGMNNECKRHLAKPDVGNLEKVPSWPRPRSKSSQTRRPPPQKERGFLTFFDIF